MSSVFERPCPQCGAPRVERTNRDSGVNFIGCSRWPDCQWTMPLPVDITMRRLGATPLPGFDAQ